MSPASSSASQQARKWLATLATIALVSITCFTVLIVALHFLRSDQNLIARPTSEYAVGPYGFLMTLAFLSMSAASLALVAGLYRGLSPEGRSRIGLGLLGLWGVAVLIAAAFPIDLDGAPQTMSGTIHRINGRLAFASLTAGVLLVSSRLKHDERWRPFSRPALILSPVMLAAAVATLLSMATESGFGGLGQRVFLATFVTWFLLVAGRLRSIASGS